MGVLYLLLIVVPVIEGRSRRPQSWIINIRGGDKRDNEPRKARFWSLGALFRLNADAQEEALSPDGSASLHGRGGALAVYTPKRLVDEKPVLTAASRLLKDEIFDEQAEEPPRVHIATADEDEESEELEEDLEENDDLERVEEESSSDDVQIEEDEEYSDGVQEDDYSESEDLQAAGDDRDAAEVLAAVDEEDYSEDFDLYKEKEEDSELLVGINEDEESDGLAFGETDDSEDLEEVLVAKNIVDETPVATASTRLLEDEAEMDGVAVVTPSGDVPAVETPGDQEINLEKDESAFVEEPKSRPQQSVEVPSRRKSLLNVATKLWWTNVWTEQTSEALPDLEEIVSDDESDVDTLVLGADDAGVVMEENQREEEKEEGVEIEVVHTSVLEVEQEPVPDEDSLQARLPEPDVLPVESTIEETPDVAPLDEFKQDKESTDVLVSDAVVEADHRETRDSPFVSSGYWGSIDQVFSFGLSKSYPQLKLSRHLRSVRKAAAHATGLHGLVSGKGKELASYPANAILPSTQTINEEDLGRIQRRIAAIQIAKQKVDRRAAKDAEVVAVKQRRGLFRRGRNNKRNRNIEEVVDASSTASVDDEEEISTAYLRLERELLEEQKQDRTRRERVKEIDKLIQKGQRELLELQCEKDDLQGRPNPLYNYTTTSEGEGTGAPRTSRKFNFPPEELVDEYLDELFANGRLEKMNHTYLWKSGSDLDDDEDETIGDDLLTPSADARRLYEIRQFDREPNRAEPRNGNGNGGGGSWLLRQNIGKGGSLGEKIGETTETAAYKAICTSVMQVLAKSIAAIHGVNIMTHSDIRLFMEQSPDLPPVGKNVIPGSDASHNYAQEAIMDAMRKGVRRHKKRRSKRQRVEEAFLQRDAVVETLISHCQISAPLLKLFPLAWQRALLGNIITLIAAVVGDFCDGIQLQILGHQLSFSFKPITESDMIQFIGMAGNNGFNNRRARPEEFEAAVRATAEDVSENLQFLDRWHHRALGSGMLRAQIANLIARIVLTLADEVLSGARMDLWSAQAGGPRMLAGLEYRTTPENMGPIL